jgi:predicted transcriptional regulator of viral defense system
MTQEALALQLARQHGVLRASAAREQGVTGAVLSRLVRKGELHRVSRGLYMLPDAEITEHHTLAEVARRVPAGVVCLLSALRFHGLTTAAPYQVWLAIEAHSHRPRVPDLPLRLVEMSGDAFCFGVERHEVEGVQVALTSSAKTVADCFRFRSAVGLDLAIEALRAYVHGHAGSIDALYEAARASRARTIIRPYIEAMV